MHLGHYKCLLMPVYGEDYQLEMHLTIQEIQEMMFTTQLEIVSLAIKIGSLLAQFQHAINFFIPIDPIKLAPILK